MQNYRPKLKKLEFENLYNEYGELERKIPEVKLFGDEINRIKDLIKENTFQIWEDPPFLLINDTNKDFRYFAFLNGMNLNIVSGTLVQLRFFINIETEKGNATIIDGYPQDKITLREKKRKITLKFDEIISLLTKGLGLDISKVIDFNYSWDVSSKSSYLETGFSEGYRRNVNWIINEITGIHNFRCVSLIRVKEKVNEINIKSYAQGVFLRGGLFKILGKKYLESNPLVYTFKLS